MLRSLSLKKDKSQNPTYILVNQVRATMMIWLLLFNISLCPRGCVSKKCLSLIRERIGKGISPIFKRDFAFCERALDVHSHHHFPPLISSSLRLRTACTFKSQTGPVTSSSRTESTTITIERPSQKMRRKRCELNSCRGSLESSF
jgi:hypothetical protein